MKYKWPGIEVAQQIVQDHGTTNGRPIDGHDTNSLTYDFQWMRGEFVILDFKAFNPLMMVVTDGEGGFETKYWQSVRTASWNWLAELEPMEED